MPDGDERKFVMDDELKCSFCDKGQQQVELLVAGPGVAICNECVDLCNEVIAGARAARLDPSRGQAAVHRVRSRRAPGA